MFGNAVSKIIRAGVVIYSARILEAAGYGVFSYALSFAAFFTVFSDIGLSGLLTRELAKGEKNKEAYLATSFYIKLFLVLVSILFAAFIGPFFTRIEEAKRLIPIVAFLMAFDSMRAFFVGMVRAYNKMEIESSFTIFTEVAIAFFSILVLIFVPSPILLTIAYTFGSLLGLLGIAFYTRKIWIAVIKNFFRKELIKPILKNAWPFAAMGLLGTFMINIDSVILGIFRSAEELGYYAAAQKPIQILYLLASIISASFFPLLSSMVYKNEKEKIENLVTKLVRGIIVLALPLTFGGIILSKKIILLFFGEEYLPANFTFQLLLLTLYPVFLGLVLGNVIFAYNLQRIFIKTTGIGAILNTILDLLLIPPYGIWGSAIATIISNIASNVYTFLEVNKIIKIDLLKISSKIFVATILMSAFVFVFNFLGINLILNVFLGVAFYLAFLFLLKEPLIFSLPFIDKIVRK